MTVATAVFDELTRTEVPERTPVTLTFALLPTGMVSAVGDTVSANASPAKVNPHTPAINQTASQRILFPAKRA